MVLQWVVVVVGNDSPGSLMFELWVILMQLYIHRDGGDYLGPRVYY